MGEAEMGRLRICIDAEIARARLEHLVAEADDVTVLWISGIVMAAMGGCRPLAIWPPARALAAQ